MGMGKGRLRSGEQERPFPASPFHRSTFDYEGLGAFKNNVRLRRPAAIPHHTVNRICLSPVLQIPLFSGRDSGMFPPPRPGEPEGPLKKFPGDGCRSFLQRQGKQDRGFDPACRFRGLNIGNTIRGVEKGARVQPVRIQQ